ncbi:AsmA family protein [Dongia sp.]|uniref:AsmA family protein n=1 Tax=Dongia sp. TaxID=1977262 RepID=UPI0035AFD2C9
MRLKTILAGLVMLVVALAATLVAIVKSTDFNAYKDLIAQQVKAATGRDLVLAGNVELGISLKPVLTVSQVTFRNADWGSEPTMLKFDRLSAEIELLPLISNEIIINRITLSDADVLLETNKDGVGNWVMGAAGGQGSSAPLPHVGEVQIERLKIRYRDGESGVGREVDIDSLNAKTAAPGAPIQLALKAAMGGETLSADGEIGALRQFSQGPFPLNLKGSVGAVGFSVDGQIADPAQFEGIDVDLSLASDTEVAFGDFKLPGKGPYRLAGHLTGEKGQYKLATASGRVGDSDFAGDLEYSLGEKRPLIGLRLASTHLNSKDFGLEPVLSGPDKGPKDGRAFSAEPWDVPQLDMLDADVTWTAQEFAHGPYPLKNASIELHLRDGKLTLTNVTGNLVDGRFSAGGTLDTLQVPPPLVARIRADEVAAVPLLETMGLAGVLQAKKANLEVEIAGPASSLRSLMAGADGNVMFETGSGRLENSFVKLFFANLFSVISVGGSGDASQVNCLVTRFDIKSGIAQSKGLVLDTPGATVLGQGNIDLRNERLDLHLDTQSKQVNLANLAVPMNVTGPLSKPSVTPDAVGTVENTAGFATRAANFATFGALAAVTGLGESKDLGPNPCRSALDAGVKAEKSATPGQKIIEGSGQVLEGVGEGAGQVIEGVGDGAKKLGKETGKALESIGDGINNLFGN